MKRSLIRPRRRQIGAITTAANGLLLLSKAAAKLRIEKVVSSFAISSIRGYQRYLSPRKGFCCAYGQLHNTASCSAYFKQAIEQFGLPTAVTLFKKRLRHCQKASRIVNASRSSSSQRKRKTPNECQQYCDCASWYTFPCEIMTSVPVCDCDIFGCDIFGCDF